MAFHALTYKGVSVYAVGQYIPASNDKHDTDSKRILAFKDGDKNAIKYFIQETQQIFMAYKIGTETFSVATIPSSTANKAHKGFPELFNELSNLFSIENPTRNILHRTASKQPAHLGGDRSIQANELTLAVHESHGDIKGKNIILFDDVLTSGNSLKAGINILVKKGANVTLAIVMGRTIQS